MTVLDLAPRARGTAVALRHYAEKLRQTPGEWVEWPFGFRNKAAAQRAVRMVRKGSIAFPPGEFEAMRSDLDHRYRVLVRARADH